MEEAAAVLAAVVARPVAGYRCGEYGADLLTRAKQVPGPLRTGRPARRLSVCVGPDSRVAHDGR